MPGEKKRSDCGSGVMAMEGLQFGEVRVGWAGGWDYSLGSFSTSCR